MSATWTEAPPVRTPPAVVRRRRSGSRGVVVGATLVGVALALLIHARHVHEIPSLVRGALAGLVLFAVCGDALAQALVPRGWRPLTPIFALPLGAAAGALVLTAFGLAHVPLHVSLWLTLLIGAAASFIVRRRGLGERAPGADSGDGPAALSARARLALSARARPALSARARRALSARARPAPAAWLAVLFVLFWVALIPAGSMRVDTIFGENPDASQVAGIAVLFQHVSPTATDVALPLDAVPPEWRFRYPIFYPLAAASNLAHLDPIRVFPVMAALLMVIAAFGFAMLAVQCLGAPAAAGPAIAVAIAISWVSLHLTWHPYWNQLWGTAMLPYAVLFGWRGLAARDARAGILCAFMLVMLWLAYPLALPYPLVVLAALTAAYWRRPRRPSLHGVRGWGLALVGLLLLAPAVVGAVIKLDQALSQLLTPGSNLWGGDITRFLPVGKFVGTGGGIVPVLAVGAVAVLGLRALPRRPRIALGLVLAGLCLLDLRFRLTASGTYMDFKHLSFVGLIVLTLAASAVARMLWSGSRATVALGAVLALAWTIPTLLGDGREGRLLPQQVPDQMFQIRQWSARLPPGATVRVDIPISGTQLWAVYMLGDRPVDTPTPVLRTTYAHANLGFRADYSLSVRSLLIDHRYVPVAPKLYAVDPPLFENSMFVLRRIAWPKRYDNVPDTASTRLVQP